MGRGAATMYAGSLADADCIVIEGSNMAENHPCAFRWVMQAKLKGAKVIHIDPRFTRTSAVADMYVPIRAGADIAFLGGLINYVLLNEKYFKDYVVNYTNAATIVGDDFKDTEDLDGVFSGLGPFKGDPINGFLGEYDNKSWQYKLSPTGVQGGQPELPKGPPFDPLVRSLLKPAAQRDPTLQDPKTVFQIVKRHYARYTPEMVERVTGCPKDAFLKVAETITANSGPERTTSFCYAVAWTQHTYGVQMIGCCALLQLLLGNMGRPGGGIMALRGHATIQGSTDVPTLYHSIHGYMSAPSALKAHDTLTDYLKTEVLPKSYWANQPKFMVSYLKSMYGDAATKDNDFGYDFHPKIDGDYSHMPMMVRMADGKVRGMFCMGQNPATSLNGRLQRKALSKLEWLVVKDNFETETASFWYAAPEVKSGEVKSEDIKTEVFLFPSAQVAEMEGSFTNTQRWVQWHEKAADPPGECRSDSWFTHQLALRLKKMYANSSEPRDQGFKNLLWDFDYDAGKYPADTRIQGEPEAKKIVKEINGYKSDTKEILETFGDSKDGTNKAQNRKADPNNSPGSHLGWAISWPANRRIMYNRASADPSGKPWSERKKWVWWDDAQKKWVGNDVPDFTATKAPDTPAKPDGIGLDAHSGADPFIMKLDGKGWLFAPTGMVDGPLPTHYEPVESPVNNPLYKQQLNPVHKYWKRDDNALAAIGDPKFPVIITTYRLTEHHLSGVMSRWLPWLAELQPELFIELSPELAKEKGINNLDKVRITSVRGSVVAKALVTSRMRPFMLDGKLVHHVGMPWHWGYMGIAVGDVTNDLTPMVADPNVSIHEGKAFMCNVEKA
ncbi:MAG: formate dehydrogenase [Chloroflexi bacterium]|nr:MAG: formate dehydrogenase [Chloroflexota bacterium]